MFTEPAYHPLRLTLLGQPHIAVDQQPVTRLLVKAQALLFYLALSPGAQSRDTLAALLWGELSQAKARANLRTALSRLRGRVGNRLQATRHTVQLVADPGLWIDVRALEQGLAGPDGDARREALALYRGEFLAGFHLDDAASFEEWALVERVRLHQLVLAGLDGLATAAAQAGDAVQAVADWRRLLALEPYRESAHRALMRMLATQGDRAAALAQFEACRQLLAAELDVAPAPATQALAAAIRAGRFPAEGVTAQPAEGVTAQPGPELREPGTTAGHRPHNLPASTTSFHGRTREIAHLLETLADPGCRLLTVTGLGGIGKTRLALAAARQVAAAGGPLFRDGVFWAPLAAAADGDGLLAAMAAAMGYRFSGSAPLLAQLQGFLRHKHLLLLLDNLEQLQAEAPRLTDLLESAPGLKLLVTSRVRLELYEEWVLELGGLPYPENDAEELTTFEAVQLFAQRARQADLGFALAAEADGVRAICRLMEGMPLGLELAASWTHAFSCADIAAAVSQNQERLAGRRRNVPRRHQSLEAVFDYSWRLLSAPERQVLMGVAIFRGGFDLTAAAAVAAAGRRVLANLVSRSLVRRGQGGRYALHEQLRRFAWRRAAPEAQRGWQQAHCAYFAGFLGERAQAMKTAGQAEVLTQVAGELNNVLAAWQTAVAAPDTARLAQMADPLYHFLGKQGRHLAGFQLFGAAVEAVRALPSAAQPTGLLASLLVRQGRCGELISPDYDTPRQLLAKGVELARQADRPEDAAQGLMGLGLVNMLGGDIAAAAGHLEESLALCAGGRYPWVAGNALNLLAWIALRQADMPRARALGQQALSVFQSLEDNVGLAATLTTMGLLHSDLGDHAAAEAVYQQALARSRQSGHRVGESQALTGLFAAAFRQGELARAQAYAAESLAVSHDVGNRLGTAIAHHNLGYAAAAAGDHAVAVTHYRQALQIYAGSDADASRASNTRRHLAESLLAQGEPAVARAELYLALRDLPPQAAAVRGDEHLVSAARLLQATGATEKAAVIVAWLQRHGSLPAAAQADVAELATALTALQEPGAGPREALLAQVTGWLGA